MEDINLRLFTQGMAVNANGAGGTGERPPLALEILGFRNAKGWSGLDTEGFGQKPMTVVGGLWNGKWDKHIQGLSTTNNGGRISSSNTASVSAGTSGGGWTGYVSSRDHSDEGPSR
jgi:hypothetical protein